MSVLEPKRAPSLNDVARHAGVSTQTVSRVANGLDNVKPQTRERVEQAMRALGYRPNHAARALRSGRFRTIGVIVFTLSSYGNTRTLEAIVDAATKIDYSITVMSAVHRTQGEVTAAFARLREQAVDGVIVVIESHILEEAEIDLPHGLPVVIIDSSSRRDASLVDTDQAQGAVLATRHLLSLGHETVAHIAGPSGSYSADRRSAAWLQTLTEAGRPVLPAFQGDWTSQRGYEIGKEIASRPEITAVFASNDQMALGLMRACHESGRSVPDSLSVVGFDDMPESASFWPPLTTVHQSFRAVGEASIASLVRTIEDAAPAEQTVIPTHLVIRASTASRSGR